MKKISKLVSVLSICLAATLLASCNGIFPSGVVVEKSFDYSGFDRVEFSHAFSGSVSQSATTAVTIRLDNNAVDGLDIYQTGTTLHIGMKPGFFSLGTMEMSAVVATPALASMDCSGASSSTVKGFTSSIFNAVASGASTIKFESMTIGQLSADFSGASKLDTDLFSKAETTVANVSGASTALINVVTSLTGSASGASNIRYSGSPTTVKVDISGASSLSQR